MLVTCLLDFICLRHYCCEGKEGLASIPSLQQQSWGSYCEKMNTEFKDHIVLSPGALQYLLHTVTNSERWDVTQIDTKYQQQQSTTVAKSCGLIIETL